MVCPGNSPIKFLAGDITRIGIFNLKVPALLVNSIALAKKDQLLAT
jgi:hypothetical protein